MTNVKALTFQGEDIIKAYVCGDCGKHWAAETRGFTEMNTEDRGHQYADQCCKSRLCYTCGTPVSWLGDCHDCIDTKRAAKAQVVDYDGESYVFSDFYDSNDGYADSISDMIGGIKDDFEGCFCVKHPDGHECHHIEQILPPYVHPCREIPFFIDAESVLESALDEHHEDADSQLVGVDALFSAIEAFNAKQTVKSYYPDYSKVIILDQKKFEDYVKVCVDKNDSKG